MRPPQSCLYPLPFSAKRRTKLLLEPALSWIGFCIDVPLQDTRCGFLNSRATLTMSEITSGARLLIFGIGSSLMACSNGRF